VLGDKKIFTPTSPPPSRGRKLNGVPLKGEEKSNGAPLKKEEKSMMIQSMV